MNQKQLTRLVGAAVLGFAALSASAQNVAIVNGKAVPVARVNALKAQIEASGQPVPPEMDKMIKDEVIAREIFMQEANRRGLAASDTYKQQMEMARQTVLIRALFEDYEAKNPVSDAAAKAEYDKFVAANGGKEYKASHILVESEDRAKAIIAEIKAGKKFEDIAKKESKDPGSGARGGDLDWANPGNYVPEFTEALVKLKKGELTAAPVKSQFGWHIIRLDDERQAEMPKFEDVKPQIVQQLKQQKLQQFQDQLRKNAKIQ
ncbi:peptidylprolyl isomerase [Comamonas sp. Y6]|uniref:peptidylprolyl isomerase n=2 Tax=Comamonas resistens TaxID=3046670 RepID=A0ABY8SLE1_9BURK|nr:peptidylprolyl isomerase [Comamonas resistens]MDL5035120.1 peptidylprolyl isomerase [Comamonas resistens]WHS63728.1 peptidylprolyl isomerase [Comamonas resistens]